MSVYKIGFYKFFLNLNKIQKNSTSNTIQNDKLNTIVSDKTLYLKGLRNPLNTNTHLIMGFAKILEILCQKVFRIL